MIVDGRPLVTTVEHRRQPVPARRRRHGRAAAALGHGDVPGQGSRPQQLPAVQPGHGSHAQGAHRDRVEPAHRAAERGSSTCTTSPSSTSSRTGSWRSRRCCAGNIPTQGFVPPERFIAVAEETGLIVPIGEFVLERAIEDMVRWRQAGAHARAGRRSTSRRCSCSAPTCPATIARLTKQHGLEPSMLQLELTESAVFERREGAHRRVQRGCGRAGCASSAYASPSMTSAPATRACRT